ncbi:hypothetical protein ACFL3D_01890 [Candidatus Omnitrophota bacterium]
MSDEKIQGLPPHLDGCTQKDLDLINYIKKQPDAGKGALPHDHKKFSENYDEIKWGVYKKDSRRDGEGEE